ncbi:flaF protein, partial [Thioclava sp. BHET1]
SYAAYKRTLEQTESPRQIERRVLTRLAALMERHQEAFDASERQQRLPLLAGELPATLWENARVWNTFTVHLADPDNGLPGTLRAGLLSIAGWVDRHTNAVCAGNADLMPLIEINRNIAGGLAAAAQQQGA